VKSIASRAYPPGKDGSETNSGGMGGGMCGPANIPGGGPIALIEPTEPANGSGGNIGAPGNIAPGGGPAITLGDNVGAGPPTVTGGAMLGVIAIIISQTGNLFRTHTI
jgi:hypothetical protein